MITATISIFEQVSPDEWRQNRYSRNFSEETPIKNVIIWASNMGVKNATINDITLHDHTGSST